MSARRFTAAALLACTVLLGQEVLDDVAIGRLVRAGIGEQNIVAMIGQQPGKYSLSSDDIITLKKAGVTDRILAAMIARNAAAAPQATSAQSALAPAALALRDATPIRLRLCRDLTFTNIKPGELVDFEILDDLRIDSLLVVAHGLRVTASIIETEPKTRMGRGGRLGVKLESIPLLNGGKIAIRVTPERQQIARAEVPGSMSVLPASMVKPAAPNVLFSYGKEESFPEGTGLTVYADGDVQLDASRFLLDIAFTSNPEGAMVSMYGTPIGRTPFTTRLAPGTYKAVFTHEGYYDLTQNITVGPGHSSTVNAPFELK